jgi:DNA-methyltransferase (dcm)
MKKINTIDLFAGCGGLMDGFEQTNLYNTIACVEWEKAPVTTLCNRLITKWKYKDAEERALRFDIQRTEELIGGWQDNEYGTSRGLDYLVKKNGNSLDLIIGGPPCQAYSIAGRIRDENGMKDDYRNYLFESYLKIVNHYKPKAFVFENVPGMLSAKPGNDNKHIAEIIKKEFEKAGYEILKDLKDAIIEFSEYGIPQKRSRVIIIGLRKDYYGNKAEILLESFYKHILPKMKVAKKRTVRDAIGDLPALYPLDCNKHIVIKGKKYSHTFHDESNIFNHLPRFHSKRDISIFKMLCEDIENSENKYLTIESLKKLYTETTGKESNIHKYHVLKWNEPSNLIPAHLYKDGLRHIHPDSKQARTITVREAARLQTFEDDYIFTSGTNLDFKMIGNAVPPLFSKKLALAVYELLFKNN